MVFSSNLFLFAFLPLALLLYFALPKKLATKNIRNSVLLVLSLVFYSWGELHYLWLLLLSILLNYLFGLALEEKPSLQKRVDDRAAIRRVIRAQARFRVNHPTFASLGHPLFQRGLVIALAVAANLLLLGYFKYANFLVENLNQIFSLQIENKKIHLPIGISFFTFHAISYLVDIYRKKCRAQRNIFDLALYISFFPQLIAGPIVRYNAIEKYLAKRRHTWFAAAAGIRRFIIGLGKKVIIANPLGEFADAVFASQISDLNPAIAWAGLAAYTLQIYFDFSGYCDMAIGLARVFGFKFPENFNYPYIARSIKDFWRRWHMSLSAWFRDYVYIPLGGNRVSLARQYFNLVLVFFLCGLWHGASWNFVIWGMIHGAFLVFERVIPDVTLSLARPELVEGSKGDSGNGHESCFDPSTSSGRARLRVTAMVVAQHFYTIFVVMIAWVFFRSPDLTHATGFLGAMFSASEISWGGAEVARLAKSHFVWMSATLAFLGFSPLLKNCGKALQKNKIFAVALDFFLILVLVLSLVRLSAATHNPFIYFQF